jgi:hypothetical protein
MNLTNHELMQLNEAISTQFANYDIKNLLGNSFHFSEIFVGPVFKIPQLNETPQGTTVILKNIPVRETLYTLDINPITLKTIMQDNRALSDLISEFINQCVKKFSDRVMTKKLIGNTIGITRPGFEHTFFHEIDNGFYRLFFYTNYTEID